MNHRKIVPYRFSNDELLLLNNLYQIFSKNGFTIEKWPEIYFCNYNDAEEYFSLPERDLEEDFIRNERQIFNPDYLGVYIHELYKEGIIILYKDRINHCSRELFLTHRDIFPNINQVTTLLKTKVLIHEIGHWITHFCSTVNKHDIIANYNFLPKTIKESMAQLTVIWSYYKHKCEFEYQFENFVRVFMPMQPYPYYEFSKFSHIYSPEIILKRYWGLASQMTHLNDQVLFELLSKNESDLSRLELDILKGKHL